MREGSYDTLLGHIYSTMYEKGKKGRGYVVDDDEEEDEVGPLEHNLSLGSEEVNALGG